MKSCNRCKNLLDLSMFHKNKGNKDGLSNRCKQCQLDYNRERYAKSPERFRAYQRDYDKRNNTVLRKKLRQYGLTESQYDAMILASAGRCDLCKGQSDLYIDHCHESGKVRGLLCLQCNTGLGSFKDDTSLLARAVQYLSKPS